MWNMQCLVMPLTTGTARSVTEGLKEYLGTIPRKLVIDTLQKTATLGQGNQKLEAWFTIGSRRRVPGKPAKK